MVRETQRPSQSLRIALLFRKLQDSALAPLAWHLPCGTYSSLYRLFLLYVSLCHVKTDQVKRNTSNYFCVHCAASISGSKGF